MPKYQTLSEFLFDPFNRGANLNKDQTYNSKYTAFVSQNKIVLKAVCEIEGSYYYHILIPSESLKDKDLKYDVIIRFFTDNPKTRISGNLNNYYVQFYSNSPSFMYRYAYVYNKNGYLIKALYNKLDPDYIDVPPSKTNADEKLFYDKSLYFACRYLNETKSRNLSKIGPAIMKRTNKDKFFKDIADFRTIKFTQDLVNQEKKLLKEVEKGDTFAKSVTYNYDQEQRDSTSRARTATGRKITPTKTTAKDRMVNIVATKKITGKSKIKGKKKK